jgi:CheY-like chemotaxis protein
MVGAKSHHRPTRETVLIVDDEPTVRGFAAGGLTQLGYHTIEAQNAANALRIMTETHADLILLQQDGHRREL